MTARLSLADFERMSGGKSLKYKNRPCMVDGIRFDSRAEAKRWAELKVLERAGQITGLERQMTFRLVVDNVLICKYVADFCYRERREHQKTGRWQDVSEDQKSPATARNAAYRIKIKLARALYPEWEFKELGK